MTELVLNDAAFARVLGEAVPAAQKFVWLATSDLKDLHVPGPGSKYIPFVAVLAQLVENGVEVRLIHAKDPGPMFRQDFDRFPALLQSDLFERILCPRMHMKVVLIDGKSAYIGSANLTGAGLGTKSPNRRNFEAGVFTTDESIVGGLMEFFDEFTIGDWCIRCQRREHCPEPIA